jgi:hypothetical protein
VSLLPAALGNLSNSDKPKQTRRRRGRHANRPTMTMGTATSLFPGKRPSLQHDIPFPVSNQEMLFAKLTEQLRAAGLPSAATACSMSIRSRCSSAPASEHGGADDDLSKAHRAMNDDDTDDDIDDDNGNGGDDDDEDDDDDREEENMIDWDEPDVPDDGNSRTKTCSLNCSCCFA